MNCHPAKFSSQLAKREILRLPNAAGTELTCLQGTLWVTEDADPSDRVLQPGQSLRLQRPGTALVMALKPATVRVERPASLPGRSVAHGHSLFSRLAMRWARPALGLASWS